MENLINNAQSQFNKNGKIVVSIYPNSNYDDEYQVVCNTFENALEVIKNSFYALNDDVRVCHPNAL